MGRAKSRANHEMDQLWLGFGSFKTTQHTSYAHKHKMWTRVQLMYKRAESKSAREQICLFKTIDGCRCSHS